MKARYLLCVPLLALIAGGFLASCSVDSVSIDQRISDFQSDLNNTNRTSAYLNFHPTMTSDYDALKDGTTITSYFPKPDGTGTPYSLTVTDESSPSTGVFVTVTGGPSLFNAGSPGYLKLVMATTGTADYRIVSLALLLSPPGTFPNPPQIK